MRVTVLNRAWLVATGLAAAVVFPTTGTMTSIARAQQPGSTVNQGQSDKPDPAAVQALLQELQQALEAKNTELAITKFHQAAVTSRGLEEYRGPLTQAATALVRAGVHADRLAPPRRSATTSATIQAGGLPQTGTEFQTGGVAQAGGFSMPGESGMVMPVQATGDLRSPGGIGSQLFSQGLDALAAGEREAAREKFVEAWKYQADLPIEVRQQLKDKLSLLQPTTPLPNGNPAALLPMNAVDQQQQLEQQQLYREVSGELSETQRISEARPLVALDRIDALVRRVEQSSANAAFKQSMLNIVQKARAEQQKYVDANRASIELQMRNEQVENELETDRVQRTAANEKVAELVEKFNDYMTERRFHEAQSVAKQVQILLPDSEISAQLMTSSQVALRSLMNEEIQVAQQESFLNIMTDVERGLVVPDPAQPLTFGEQRAWGALSDSRLNSNDFAVSLNASEERIRRQLMTSVDVRFPNKPLGDALQTLGAISGVPIVLDQDAFTEAGVRLDESVNLNLQQPVMLRSALDLILDKYDLTWMIENEVLKITSPARKRNNTVTRTYKVADLVIPIPNFVSGYDDGLAGAMRAAYQLTAQTTDVRISPMSGMRIASNQGMSTPGQMPDNMMAQYGGSGQYGGGYPTSGGQIGAVPGRGGGAMADFGSLMILIQTTIDPNGWDILGGPSTMFPYQQNLTLVISTTTDVHEQIQDLLESLRKLQNLQVTIEVRFITLSDSFYERIGIDFDVAIDDNTSNLPLDDSGPTVTVGLAGENRLLTSDLDIQFNQGSFGPAIPTFGGYTAGQGAQVGFAILSDIEAFFFLEAAQGDSRSNILQAPKVTLFDGQLANINDTVSRPFVTSIIPVVGDFAVAQQPVVVILSEGTQLNVQAVVSDDKRFVRLTLNPMFTQINDVDVFTFEGSRRTTSSRERTDPATGNPIEDDETVDQIVGTTVQQPSFANTSVSTTVSVPDGGTILLGGIKRLRENRNEVGVPMLSKIPYVSRLFRNVGIGREATSLMLMVTPRIIIQEEEELAQTGYDATNR